MHGRGGILLKRNDHENAGSVRSRVRVRRCPLVRVRRRWWSGRDLIRRVRRGPVSIRDSGGGYLAVGHRRPAMTVATYWKIIRPSIALMIIAGATGVFIGYRIEPPHGATLGIVDGVSIHYHRGEAEETRGRYGKQYECVEFVNRWLAMHGHRNLTVTGHALSYYTQAQDKGLVAYRNGGMEPPRVGDVLVFSSPAQPHGHVAVVIGVWDKGLKVAQQNLTLGRFAGFSVALPFRELGLSYDPRQGTYGVSDMGWLTCLGWARPKPTAQLKYPYRPAELSHIRDR